MRQHSFSRVAGHCPRLIYNYNSSVPTAPYLHNSKSRPTIAVLIRDDVLVRDYVLVRDDALVRDDMGFLISAVKTMKSKP